MVSKKKQQQVFFCLSTDTKPVTGVGNGDVAIEMDTGKYFFFDAGANEWLEPGGGGSDVVGAAIVGTALAG